MPNEETAAVSCLYLVLRRLNPFTEVDRRATATSCLSCFILYTALFSFVSIATDQPTPVVVDNKAMNYYYYCTLDDWTYTQAQQLC